MMLLTKAASQPARCFLDVSDTRSSRPVYFILFIVKLPSRIMFSARIISTARITSVRLSSAQPECLKPVRVKASRTQILCFASSCLVRLSVTHPWLPSIGPSLFVAHWALARAVYSWVGVSCSQEWNKRTISAPYLWIEVSPLKVLTAALSFFSSDRFVILWPFVPDLPASNGV